MESNKQNFHVSQPSTPLRSVPQRPVFAIRVLKVSRPNRHHSFPSSTRSTQIRSTHSINIPITRNDYSPSMPPTPCNTPLYSQIDIDASRKPYEDIRNNDDFEPNSRSFVIRSPEKPNKLYNNLEKNSQRFPIMKKCIIIRKRQKDQNEVVDDKHSLNLSKSSDIIVEGPILNNQLSKISSPDTYYKSIDDDLKNNPIKKKMCDCMSTKICVILCLAIFILINGAILGTILGLLFTRNLL